MKNHRVRCNDVVGTGNGKAALGGARLGLSGEVPIARVVQSIPDEVSELQRRDWALSEDLAQGRRGASSADVRANI